MTYCKPSIEGYRTSIYVTLDLNSYMLTDRHICPEKEDIHCFNTEQRGNKVNVAVAENSRATIGCTRQCSVQYSSVFISDIDSFLVKYIPYQRKHIILSFY